MIFTACAGDLNRTIAHTARAPSAHGTVELEQIACVDSSATARARSVLPTGECAYSTAAPRPNTMRRESQSRKRGSQQTRPALRGRDSCSRMST